MVTECGMSEEIGPVFVENTESPDMRRRIDGEVSRILREAYHRVKTLLVSTHSHLPPLAPCKVFTVSGIAMSHCCSSACTTPFPVLPELPLHWWECLTDGRTVHGSAVGLHCSCPR